MPFDLQPFVRVTCAALAELADLLWIETISLQLNTVTPADNPQPNPFFDFFGAWDEARMQVVVDIERCSKEWSPRTRDAMIKVVAIHYCARAVVHLGMHPVTCKRYVGWDNPQKRFASVAMRGVPIAVLRAALERERTAFTQILTYLHLRSLHSRVMMEQFERLSRGRYGFSDLDYTTLPIKLMVEPHLRRDWKEEAKADWKRAAATVAMVLGWLTREAPLPKNDSLIYPFEE